MTTPEQALRRCSNCGAAPDAEHEWYCVTKGYEHVEPDKHCRDPNCKDTNWGGYARLHMRGSECPPYDPNPEPNHMADYWEAIREMSRENARKKVSAEQQARDMLESLGVEDAQSMTAGDLVELANVIADANAYRKTKSN